MSEQLPKVGEDFGNGAKVLKSKKYSNHPDDWFLCVVLCVWGDEFVTWIYNAENGGVHDGHYYEILDEAIEDFEKRGCKKND
jgi:hypothetical protein